MKIEVRAVKRSDEAEWVRMRWALYGDAETVHADEVRRFFGGDLPALHAVLVADADGRVVGFVELSIRPCAEGCHSTNVGYLEGWYVEPAARRHGVGRALVAAGEDWARSQGCTEFASDADLQNEQSARAHAACGFVEVGRLRCFRKPLCSGR